jgi:hypothetical protein
VTRYRWVLLPRLERVGPWRATGVEAREDALAAGLAWRDTDEDRIYLDELVEIQDDTGR